MLLLLEIRGDCETFRVLSMTVFSVSKKGVTE